MGMMAENELHSDTVPQGTTDTNYPSVSSRPIRPLPKRRLRSRLSDAALFPVPPAQDTRLFYFPFNNYAGDATLRGAGSPTAYGSAHALTDGLAESSDDDDNSSTSVSRGVGGGCGAGAGVPTTFEAAASGSVGDAGDAGAGAADPYEWTENTNNKKKRKIPTHTNTGGSTGAGGIAGGCGGTHSSPGFSPTSTPRSRWKSSGGPAQRSPLTPAAGSASHPSTRRPPPRRYLSTPSTESFHRQTGAKPPSDDPVTPTKPKPRAACGPSGGTSGLPKQAQFTFVCDSPVSANLMYAPPPPAPPALGAGNPAGPDSGFPQPKSMQTVGTQTSPGISGSSSGSSSSSSTSSSYQQPPQPAKKKAPKPSRREVFQQQQRRRRQEALAHANNSNNSNNNSNNNGEIWICEFCEYESIFGEPPEALMRQYEIKDRKERRRLAEKRRLLEKAKQKGRKNPGGKPAGKKPGSHHSPTNATNTNANASNNNKPNSNGNSNSNSNSNNSNSNHSNNSAAPPPPPPPSTTDSQGTQSDNTPAASATQTPAPKPARQSQQVQTEAYLEGASHHASNGRGGSGAGGGGKAGIDDSGTLPVPA